MNPVPADLARTVVELYGTAGDEWLTRLPSIMALSGQRWSLRLLPPFQPLSYSYVAPAVGADGRDVVLKAGVPRPELVAEIEALKLFNGHDAVQLLDADPDQGILLLAAAQAGHAAVKPCR